MPDSRESSRDNTPSRSGSALHPTQDQDESQNKNTRQHSPSVASTLHNDLSEPEPGNGNRTALMSTERNTLSRVVPIPPEVIIRYPYRDGRQAWGRKGLGQIGMSETRRILWESYFLGDQRGASLKKRVKMFSVSDFNMRARLSGTFYGREDQEPILLQMIGWKEMMTTIKEIILDYTPPTEDVSKN
ncbi:hypothetical protein OBBRIDRAFT_796030 [Obba rivulosa]|uniref:Uncharacterized protein n=1 Tax=Obba rivulosa TaxID=1052685 RepID=A0A8E2DGZ9_9APHY|nr:hypothetical protein OBBRIDRAFT_796030 [Obba rivulosa]